MKLRVIIDEIKTGKSHIAVLNQEDSQRLDLQPGDRIILKNKNTKIICITQIAYSARAVPIGYVLLYSKSSDILNVTDESSVLIEPAERPKSIEYIKKKLAGHNLSKKEFRSIIEDVVEDKISEIELTYFVAGCSAYNLSIQEIRYLVDALVKTGIVIKPKSKIVVDKHCIGGVAGNRTTMIFVPILAAAGYTVPKTSSRAITSPAGTADTMECLANVSLTELEIKKILNTIGGCMVWGGALNLAPADDKIIKVEHPLSIDVSGLLLSSIMSKKLSVSATHLLIDIPWGKGSKMPTKKEANSLRRKFKSITKILGIKTKVIFTDGRSPIGNGIGPLLESIDVMKVLRNDLDAPKDLKNKGIILAGEMLELVGAVKKGKGKSLAKTLLENGSALKKMNEIIQAQGVSKNVKIGKLKKDIISEKSGKIKKIDNMLVSKIAKIAGAPKSKGCGIYLYINLGQKIKKGDKLFTIYSNSKTKLDFAYEFYIKKKHDFIRIGNK